MNICCKSLSIVFVFSHLYIGVCLYGWYGRRCRNAPSGGGAGNVLSLGMVEWILCLLLVAVEWNGCGEWRKVVKYGGLVSMVVKMGRLIMWAEEGVWGGLVVW